MLTVNPILVVTSLVAPILLLSVACNDVPNSDLGGGDQVVPSWTPNQKMEEEQLSRRATLDDVHYWFYLLDSDLDPAAVEQIASSAYEMVVIDFIASETGNEAFPMADVVSVVQSGDPAKLVLAYIDIGQAESYRSYWQDNWRVGHPAWIAGDDPDGWQDNYPVAFWHSDWQEIWLGDGGLIQNIVDSGFDGIYLDWIEAYSDEQVMEIAASDNVDASQEMIQWVSDLAGAGRERHPEFLVIGQNAVELLDDQQYINTIDAIAQEQIWFDGGADNEPQGDCPLPRTDDEIELTAYRNGLSDACRRQFDNYPESTLHVSSEWYLDYLEPAKASGLPIFTVDYALDPENVAWIYQTSRAKGFVPFVSNRALDTFVDPVK